MATRSAIGEITEHSFEGVYVHWDGHPDSVGKTFVDAAKAAPDLAAFVADVLAHDAGYAAYPDEPFDDDPMRITEVGQLDTEFAYGIDVAARTVTVFHHHVLGPVGTYSIDEPIDWAFITAACS